MIELFSHPVMLSVLIGVAVLALILGHVLGASKTRRAMQEKQDEAGTLLASQHAQQLSFAEQQKSQLEQECSKLLEQIETLRENQLATNQQLGQLGQQAELIPALKQEKHQLEDELKSMQSALSDLRARSEADRARFEQEAKTNEEKLALLKDTEKRLQEQFENLANKIFEQKNQSFQQTSKAGLDALLNPLKDQIEGFKKQVTDQYVKEGQERASLKTEILGLKELNQQITQEAAALTKALKGDSKQQGNWGEVVLERILKESGLREGHEFDTQVSLRDDGGKLYQPDVVVHLPNDKDVVIDSKVSLAAYERYFNAEDDDAERARHLSEHVTSLRTHIKDLGKKDYQSLKGVRTLDYILMFVPVEPAFLLAVEEAPDLVKLALDNNIMLVSPTNLLVALRTINNIWQYEYQNQNAQRIADNAAKLYDKFHGFITDMEKIGRAIDTTQKSYEGAMSKLSSGRSNLVRQVEQFRKLGVQSNKKLEQSLLDKADAAEDEAD